MADLLQKLEEAFSEENGHEWPELAQGAIEIRRLREGLKAIAQGRVGAGEIPSLDLISILKFESAMWTLSRKKAREVLDANA